MSSSCLSVCVQLKCKSYSQAFCRYFCFLSIDQEIFLNIAFFSFLFLQFGLSCTCKQIFRSLKCELLKNTFLGGNILRKLCFAGVVCTGNQGFSSCPLCLTTFLCLTFGQPYFLKQHNKNSASLNLFRAGHSTCVQINTRLLFHYTEDERRQMAFLLVFY